MKKYILKNQQEVEAIPIGRAKIIIGETRNRLTICDRGPTPSSKKTQVICQCSCGQYTMINLQDFLSGKVKSCGCYSSEKKIERCKKTAVDFTQSDRNINPFYKYISPTSQRKHSQIVWEIECRKCKKHYFEAPNELISEKRTHGSNPCECYRKYSIGVQKIKYVLEENNIEYHMEKTFDTCVSPKGNLLSFDFYLPNFNILIEYDGEQHFKTAFGQQEEKLILQQLYDNIKTEWCSKNNIKLIRIPYNHKNIKISDIIQ